MGVRRRCVSIPASTICLKQRKGHLISKFSLKFQDKQRGGGGGGIGLTLQLFFFFEKISIRILNFYDFCI